MEVNGSYDLFSAAKYLTDELPKIVDQKKPHFLWPDIVQYTLRFINMFWFFNF